MLRRFTAYLIKVFDFPAWVDSLTDERPYPQVPTANVWRSLFLLFALRLGSFHALEQELRRPKRLERWIGKRKPSADTLRYALERFDREAVRTMLSGVSRGAWRRKAIHLRPGERLRVVAVDGHELWSSQHRCCPQCLERKVTVKKDGELETVVEYYHRVVVAQWVGVTPPGILDLERVLPHEGEVVAARRLVQRILEAHTRLIDVICGDALYLEAPFIKLVLKAGKHVVITLKQEERELYRDANQLRATTQPQVVTEGNKTTTMWDLPDLETFSTLGKPMRVVWVVERTERMEWRGGKKVAVVDEKTWIWVTDMSSSSASGRRIQRWGHDRWDIENRCFNELSALWGMNHCYAHHERAIEVLLLTLAIAFLTTYLFYERNLKPSSRVHMTRLALASRLPEDLAVPQDLQFWGCGSAPG